MPNHVTNKVEITSGNAQEALSFMCSDARKFDFNNVIPMPESLNIESGTLTDAALAFYLTQGLTKAITRDQIEKYFNDGYFSNKFDDADRAINSAKRCVDKGLYSADHLLEIGKKVVLNIETYNCQTWYEWSHENWGTKWNAYDIEVTDKSVEFDTAWKSPTPVLEAWISKFKLNCTVKAFDEGHCFWFIKTYVNGVLSDFRDSLDEDRDSLCKELKKYDPSKDEEDE
ncbi:hypothetical protein [Acinetobacter sp. BSP-28]|uniref:DUF1281 family ferredoxin-like fold protein n=1 Tax=Acinetobacter sp. BSP-28 TaxID=3344661 RepID=UPI0037706FDA